MPQDLNVTTLTPIKADRKPSIPDGARYVILVVYGRELTFPERDLSLCTREAVINDLLKSEYDVPRKVFCFDERSGFSADVSHEIADEVVDRAIHEGRTLDFGTRTFCEQHNVDVAPALIAA